jgi:hypothetical protein
VIDQPADDNDGKTKDSDDSPTYLDLYKGNADEQTEHTSEDQQCSAQKANPLKDRPKWTDVAIVLLTGGIVFLAFMQWREMSNAGVQTDKIIAADERIAKAMESSLGKAQQAFDATTKQAILAERAWLGVIIDSKPIPGSTTAFEVGHPLFTRITIKNVGRTPAIEVRTVIRHDVVPGEKFGTVKLPDFNYRSSNYAANGNIPPEGHIYTDQTGPNLTPEQVLDIKSMAIRIYFHGRSEYRDVFDTNHWITFCYFLLPGGGYEICPTHNDIDRN